MEERMMTPEEEAVLNMELFKTEELFKARVLDVLQGELNNHHSNLVTTLREHANGIALQKVNALKQGLVNALDEDTPARRIGNINIY